jgi:hypothetical protein
MHRLNERVTIVGWLLGLVRRRTFCIFIPLGPWRDYSLAFRRIDSKKRAFESNRSVPCILLLQSGMDIGAMHALVKW